MCMKKNLIKIALLSLICSCTLNLVYSSAQGEKTPPSKTDEVINTVFEDTEIQDKKQDKVVESNKETTQENNLDTNINQNPQDIKEVENPQIKENKPAVKLETVNNYFIGVFRLYDEETGKTYDFQANKAFTYDYKKPVPPLKVDKASLAIFINQIEDHFSNKSGKTVFYPKKIANSNKYEIVSQKMNLKIIDSKKFEEELARRIRVADYTPVKIPFMSNAAAEKKALEKEIILLSTYTTKYNSYDVGRTSNIVLAGQEINGTKLAPNEKFYYNSRISKISPNLKTAKVIIDNEFVDGIGGGLCQVSTTLFNSVLESGLQIDSRRNHTLPVNYVPRGRDAMVSEYNDFVFTNNFKNDIYITYERKANNEITFKIYGSKADKKNINIWVNGSGKNFTLHRKVGGSLVEESFYSNYQSPKKK